MLRTPLKTLTQFLALLVMTTGGGELARAQVSGTTTLNNTAQMTYADNGQARTVSSNTTTLTASSRRRPALYMMELAVGASGTMMPADDSRCLSTTGAWTSPAMAGMAAARSGGVSLRRATSYHAGEPIFIDVAAPDSNLDASVRERVQVTVTTSSGDREVLDVLETGPDTGRFVGFVPTSDSGAVVQYDCDILAARGMQITVQMSDPYAPNDPVWIEAPVDPYGFVFDSRTGEPVNGVKVTIIDEATGLPAVVTGDDGISQYPSSVYSGQDVTDEGGSYYAFTNGQYRFPLLPRGRYHLLIEPPLGYGAPSILRPEALTGFLAPDQARFDIADGSYGRPFDLIGPDPLKLDIPIDHHNGGLRLEKAASVTDAEAGDFVRYRLTLTNGDPNVGLASLEITDALPRGFRYVAGSSRRDGARIPDPTITSDGRGLTYSLTALGGGAVSRLDYVTVVGGQTPAGEAINHAAVGAGPYVVGSTAEAAVKIRPPLFTDAFTLVGLVTEGVGEDACAAPRAVLKGVAGVRLLLDDGTYVSTDEDGLYHLEGLRPGLHVVQIDLASLPEAYEVVACGDDTRHAGRAFSRFVEGQGGALQRIDWRLRRKALPATTPAAATPTASQTDQQAPTVTIPEVSKFVSKSQDTGVSAPRDQDWTQGQAPGLDWLFPAVDHNPRAPVVRVAIKHLPGQRLALSVNGAPVDVLAREPSTASADGQVQVALWSGVALKEGDNLLRVEVGDAQGRPVAVLSRTIHYANVASRAEVVLERSTLVADGRTRPVVALRLLDASGHPVRAGSTGALHVASPYTAAQEIAAQQERQLQGQDGGATHWRVEGDDGVALVTLAPTTQAGFANIDLPLAGAPVGRPVRARAWLKAGAQDWVVVGFGSGTAGFDLLSRHGLPTAPGDKPDHVDGQVSLYAKGKIRGDWLLTLSYDSKRKKDDRRGLLSVIDPNRYYTVYGDGSAQAYDAPTQGKLYLRLERDTFYALFGDYEAGFEGSDLGRYVRTLHGAKVERQGKRLSWGGFAAKTAQSYARDEIQGSGLSGPYRLSRHDILPNTDKLVIETRDRVRAERVVASRALTRQVDYDIDYATGLVQFRAPVLSVDPDLNPNVIVAEYEVDGVGAKTLEAGARAEADLAHGVKADATYLHGRSGPRAAAVNLAAAGLTVQAGAATVLRLEAAASQSDAPMARRQAAYVAELRHASAGRELTAYFRQADQDFGLGQQGNTILGSRKVGLDGKTRLAKGLGLSASAYHETFIANGATRDLADVRLDYALDGWALNTGLKMVRDQTAEPAAQSHLLTLGAGRAFLGQRLQVNVSTDLPLGDRQSVDFPARTQLGATYALNDTTRVLVRQEFTKGARYGGATTRAGLETSPWKGASLSNTLGRQDIGEYGPRTFAQMGLTQTLRLSERWTVDASLDASRTLSGAVPLDTAVDPNRPTAGGGTIASTVGQNGAADGLVAEDFTAVGLGGAYRARRWSWNGRAEFRDGQYADTWNLRSAYLRQLREGVAATASLRAYETLAVAGQRAGETAIDAALAWRPLDSRWSVLERLTLKQENAQGTQANQALAGYGALAADDGRAQRVINNLAVNYDTDSDHGRGGLQLSAYLGVKFVRSSFDADVYKGAVQILGFEGRYDVSRRIDLGLAATVRHVGATHDLAYAFGPSIGVSPDANTWISLGWNVRGFHDRDFEDARYTRQGAYLTARFKFDQLTFGRRAAR
jgi:uncharacterized repeat protein (TIGR01451 family)